MLKKIILIFTFLISFFSVSTFAQENKLNKEFYKDLESTNFLLGKVVDSETKKPLPNVIVKSEISNDLTDKNGEFLIKIKESSIIKIQYPDYKIISIRVSDLKGKILLEKIPNYLSIFPNGSISLNYQNLGYSEEFEKRVIEGRFNDSFSINGNWKLFKKINIGFNYDNYSANRTREINSEKSTFSRNDISLNASYILNLIDDQLDIAIGLDGFTSNDSITTDKIEISNEAEDEERENDWSDFSNQKIGLGAILNIGTRPIRYLPLVLNGYLAYYPIVNVNQEEKLLPNNMNRSKYGIQARYDMLGVFAKAEFFGDNYFGESYSANSLGINLGLGYGF